MESFYDDVPGQWWGIWLVEAKTSNINYAIIKNGSVGLEVDTTQAALTLNMTNTIITNHDFFSLLVNAGANVQVSNCLLGDAGLIGTLLYAGGEYHFDNCDFVNYWPGSRGGPSLKIENHWVYEGVTYCRPIIADFGNNVVYGTIDDEFEVDTLDCSVNMVFNNNYFKRTDPYYYPAYSATNIWSGNPAFYDVSMKDFHIVNGSPLIDSGSPSYNPGQDIEGNVIMGGAPDIGCYEYQP